MDEYQEILKRLEPERVEIINRCISKLQGKSDMEVLSIVTEAAKEFNSAGKRMSDDERKALIYAMRSKLDGNNLKMFDYILTMMKMK